jgi:hypothetical protein
MFPYGRNFGCTTLAGAGKNVKIKWKLEGKCPNISVKHYQKAAILLQESFLMICSKRQVSWKEFIDDLSVKNGLFSVSYKQKKSQFKVLIFCDQMSKIFFPASRRILPRAGNTDRNCLQRERVVGGSINNMAGSLQILLLLTVAALTAAAPTPHEVGSCLVLLVMWGN